MTVNEPITPAAIRQQEFSIGWRGYVPGEVRTFLEEMAEAITVLMQVNQTLRSDLARQEEDLSEYKRREHFSRTR